LNAAICPRHAPLAPAVATDEYVPVALTARSAPLYVAREVVVLPLTKLFLSVNELFQALILVLAFVTIVANSRSLAFVVVTEPDAGEMLVPVEVVVLTASRGLVVAIPLYS